MSIYIKNINRSLKSLCTAFLLTTVVGCSTATKVISNEDRLERVNADIAGMFDGQEAVTGPISIGEAIARALSYNLDYRLKQMELAVASGKHNLSTLGMLPKLVAQAGYSERSNDPGARSVNLETGEESLPPSSSAERRSETAEIAFTWNVLDFGLSYHSAKQDSDSIKIAEERRRKTVQNITQDVVDAFWKAWISQELEREVDALLAETREALVRSRSLADKGVQNSNEALKAQVAMLNSISALLEIREKISLSKTRLAALMNVSPGSVYQVVAPEQINIPLIMEKNMSKLVRLALSNRPELREEDYKKRISEAEVKKTFLKFFPNLNLTTGRYRDENTFLVNNSWSSVGKSISWDLFGIINVASERKLNKAKVDLADTRRKALSMAVMTQVYLATSRYELSRARYLAASELHGARQRLAANTVVKGSRVSGTNELEARSAAIAAKLRSDLAFAAVQTSFSRVVNSVGIDPLPSEVQSYELSVLATAFDKRWASISAGFLNTAE